MASNSRVSRSFPTLRYLAAPFRWIFRSRRRMATVAAVLLAMIAAPSLWWSIQLIGLPDIGEPFDVAAFRSSPIPEDRNAFVLYRQAAALLKPLRELRDASDKPIDLLARWSKADPAVRRWAEENREAMALYRQVTERPDALNLVPPFEPESWKLLEFLRSFHVLALLEASRREEQGDMAGAWGWYRAALRASCHVGLHGSIVARMNAQRWHGELRGRLAAWAADPRTTPAMLRQALDAAVACGALAPSESDTLKAEYLQLERMLDSEDNPGRYVILVRLNAVLGSSNYQPSPEQMKAMANAWRFWRREPERSRRVMRVVIANWLAYEELPPDRRPSADPNVSGPFDFYAFGPEAPAKARALSPEALVRWLNTTYDAQELLPLLNLRALRVRERADHRALVVLLARELYRRDHGTDPPSDEALVGAYLKELPDDGLGEAGHPAASGAGEAPGARGSTGRE